MPSKKISRRDFTKLLVAAGFTAGIGGGLLKWQVESIPEGRAETSLVPQPNEVWIPTVDLMCPVSCGLLARRVDGRLVKIEGNPDHPLNKGRICPKGNSGIMTLYDPYRVKAPLKRTNPEKGKNVDPKWQEISWDEAISIVASRLREVRFADPRKFVMQHGENEIPSFTKAFVSALGSPNEVGHGSVSEAALDVADKITWGISRHRTDVDYCNYLILFGTNAAAESNTLFLWYAQHIGEARTRGMKLVVVDPRLTNSAAIADKWVPIIPGTDAALALGMASVLIQEGFIDKDFIKKATNGPYLVGADGYFLRKGGKPLIWDSITTTAVTWDRPGIDPSITGSFVVDGVPCKPAFQMLIDLVEADYTVEKVSEITGVPSEMISELAREFGEAARIGSTIMIGDRSLPYRPVAAEFYRGVCAHEHGTQNSRVLLILNMLVGNIDAVGGISLMGAGEGDDNTGMLKPPPYDLKFPPERLDLQGSYYPLAYRNIHQQVALTLLDPEKYRLPYSIDTLMLYYVNTPLQVPQEKIQIKGYLKVPFIISIDAFMSEASELADIVLPDRTYLERTDLIAIETPNDSGDALRQPVVEPLYKARHVMDILTDIAEKVGFLYGKGGFNDHINVELGLKPPYQLDLDKKYSNEEVIDRWCKSKYGSTYGLAWFKTNSVKTTPLETEKKYQRYIIGGKTYKMHLYSEFLKKVGGELKNKVEAFGAAWWDKYQYYNPLPTYIKSTATELPNEYDLQFITYKLVEHTQSRTAQNAWLMELYGSGLPGLGEQQLWINPLDAAKRGIQDGDEAWVESTQDRIRVKVKLREGIQPGVVGLSQHFGHWAFNPIAKDKGVNPNTIIATGDGYIDPISGQQAFNDMKVKVYRV